MFGLTRFTIEINGGRHVNKYMRLDFLKQIKVSYFE